MNIIITLSSRIIEEYKGYFKTVPSQSNLVVIPDAFNDYLLNLGKDSMIEINSRYLAAVSFDNDGIIGWFNNEPLHTAPLSLNLINNAVVRAALGSDHSIRVINKPLPYPEDSQTSADDTDEVMSSLFGLMVGCAMAFVTAFYVMYYIKVRHIYSIVLHPNDLDHQSTPIFIIRRNAKPNRNYCNS